MCGIGKDTMKHTHIRIAYGPAQILQSTGDETYTNEKGESQLGWNQQTGIWYLDLVMEQQHSATKHVEQFTI
jgi:hypothetical protein